MKLTYGLNIKNREQAMFTKSFHDLDEGYKLQTTIHRNNGNEIAFDFWHSGQGLTYTVKLSRNNGSIFTGTATSRESPDVAQLTGRVFIDPDTGDTIIYGNKWLSPDNPHEFMWLVRIEGEQK